MIYGNKDTKPRKEPPGSLLKKLAQNNRVLETLLSHMNVLEVIDDHQLMWFEARTQAEKLQVQRRFQWQLARAGVNTAGVELTLHGTVVAVAGDLFRGGSFFILGTAILYFMTLKGR